MCEVDVLLESSLLTVSADCLVDRGVVIESTHALIRASAGQVYVLWSMASVTMRLAILRAVRVPPHWRLAADTGLSRFGRAAWSALHSIAAAASALFHLDIDVLRPLDQRLLISALRRDSGCLKSGRCWVILVSAATLLASETKSLLIGEGVRGTTLNRICELVQQDPTVERAGRPPTTYLGPETILLALDIQFRRTLSAVEVTDAVDRMERVIRLKFPRIQHIYIEAEALTAPTRSAGGTSPENQKTTERR